MGHAKGRVRVCMKRAVFEGKHSVCKSESTPCHSTLPFPALNNRHTHRSRDSRLKRKSNLSISLIKQPGRDGDAIVANKLQRQ